MKELRKEIKDKAMSQTFKSDDVNAVDVMVWLIRHAGGLLILTPIIVFVSTVVWRLYMKPEVKSVAAELDKPLQKQIVHIKDDVRDLKKSGKETFYIVKKMELVQNRTSPPDLVREAEEEIEIEKIKDMD